MYKFFCFKIEIKTRADLYMPCEAMAHSTKSDVGKVDRFLIFIGHVGYMH
jgi:hypothetical protein